MTDLGQKLLKSNKSNDISEKLDRLHSEQESIMDLWNKKYKSLQQNLQLRLFNKEADKIDAITSGHLAFLEFNDLGVSTISY